MEVIATDEFEAWFLALSDDHARAVDRVVGLLEAKGLGLGAPYSSAILGWKYAVRELRVQSQGQPQYLAEHNQGLHGGKEDEP